MSGVDIPALASRDDSPWPLPDLRLLLTMTGGGGGGADEVLGGDSMAVN
jgi:hypothetical protein